MAHQRRKLERLCRYVARPAVATDQLTLTRQGYVRYQLKTPYRDGTAHIIFEPLDYIARLAVLISELRVYRPRFQRDVVVNGRFGSSAAGGTGTPKSAVRKVAVVALRRSIGPEPVISAVRLALPSPPKQT